MGAKYVMVIHPDQFQVEEDLREQVKRHFRLDLGDYDFDRPQKFIASYCASRNIPYLDLLPLFRVKGASGGLYRFRDTHYSPEGNALAAEAILRFLRQRRFLPPT